MGVSCSPVCFPLSVGGSVALAVSGDFQGAFLQPDLKAAGPGHLPGSVKAQLRRLQQECSSLSPGQQERLLGFGDARY